MVVVVVVVEVVVLLLLTITKTDVPCFVFSVSNHRMIFGVNSNRFTPERIHLV